MVSDLSTIIITGRLNELKHKAEELNQLPVAVSFLCNPFAVQDLKELLHYVFAGKLAVPFSITVDFTSAQGASVPKEWADTLCLLFAHLQYQKTNNNPVLNTSGFIQPLQTVMEGLLHLLTLQGYSQVALQHLNATTEEQEKGNRLLVINEWKEAAFPWFYGMYRSHVVNTRMPLPVFANCSAVPLGPLMECREKADRKMEQEESHLYYVLREVRRCTAELNQTRQSWKLTAEELKSKKDYLDYLLGKIRRGNDEDFEFTDIVRLKRFYQNEYEILPLWYKQFGHVIKVMMGKRTLRSLFRDDVKKYK